MLNWECLQYKDRSYWCVFLGNLVLQGGEVEDECSLFTHGRHILGIVSAGFHPLTLARGAKVFLAHLTPVLLADTAHQQAN